jgi:hypothetical protein
MIWVRDRDHPIKENNEVEFRTTPIVNHEIEKSLNFKKEKKNINWKIKTRFLKNIKSTNHNFLLKNSQIFIEW